MDFLTNLLASEQVQTALIGIVGLVLTVIINRAAGAFTAATGLEIEKKHREALHEAIITSVESGIRHGAGEAEATLRAHVMAHLRRSVPDALKALTPGDGVIDQLIDRYAAQAIDRLGGQRR